MRKVLETTLHEYGLVALSVHNPQLAVGSCCRSKDRGRGSVSGRSVKALLSLSETKAACDRCGCTGS